MKVILQTGILMLYLLVQLTNAEDFCFTYINQYNRFRTECNLNTHRDNITTCCDLRIFEFEEQPLSGVYTIRKGVFDRAYAFCDMNTTDGGWIVVQRNRAGSSLDFNRNFTDYERGFGDLNGDFWYGLEAMHCLTQTGVWEMRIDYEFNNTKLYLHYTSFRIDPARFYRMILGTYQGIGGPQLLQRSSNRVFSTADRDLDGSSTVNCAAQERSGFWYAFDGRNPQQCATVNLNAQPPIVGVEVDFVEMKIRQVNCNI